MRTIPWIAVITLAVPALACAHAHDENASQPAKTKTETTGAPLYYPPGTEMQRGTTGTDQSPGSEAWGTSGASGTAPPRRPDGG
jgi:hypothetical protein